jgi:hypothetical protein
VAEWRDQQIVGLEVPVDDAEGVQVLHCKHRLRKVEPEVDFIKSVTAGTWEQTYVVRAKCVSVTVRIFVINFCLHLYI